MSTTVRIAVVFHSGYGHTAAKQAQAVARELPTCPAQPSTSAPSRTATPSPRAARDALGGAGRIQRVEHHRRLPAGRQPTRVVHRRVGQSDGDASPDLAPPASDLATAEALGRRVAEVARDYNAGRRAATAA